MEEETKVKTKNKKGLVAIIIAIILILAIIVGVAYYFMVFTKPDTLYKRLVGTSINSYQKSVEKNTYNTINTSIGANVNVELEEEDEDSKQILDFINKLNLTLNSQINKEQKQIVAKIEADYKNEDLLNASAYIDAKNEKTYVYLNDLFDKYIEAEMDEEGYEAIDEIFESMYNEKDKESLEKSLKIIDKEVKEIIKKEYCDSKKEDITINGKTIKTTKNTISMTYKQLSEELITLFTNLKDNQEFLNCYEEPERLKEGFEELIEKLEDEKDSYEDISIKISIYTKGLLQETVKTDMEMQEDDENTTIEITKKDKENYEFKISSSEDEKTITGNVNVIAQDETKATSKIEMTVPEFGIVTLNLDIKNEYNKEIEKVDNKNTIKQEEMTQEDFQTILKNLEKTKIYELISEASGGLGNLEENNFLENDNDIDETEEPDREDEEEEENTSSTNTNTSTNISTKSNQILTYDNKQKITFNIPSEFEENYKSNNYFSLVKNNTDVTIKSQYASEKEYFESIENTKQYYAEDANYKNVELSDLKTIDVNGRTFSYKILKYDYDMPTRTITYRNIYLCSKISDKNIVIVETRDQGELTNEELKQLINIKVEDM